MDGGINLKKFAQWLGKYKYALLVLLLGIALLAWPDGKSDVSEESEPAVSEPVEFPLEQRLEQVLSQVEGAGRVQVVLTLKTGTEYIYQTDSVMEERLQDSESDTSSSITTVMVNTDGKQEAVVAQTIYPTYQGAVILCQGGDQPGVRLDLINAVSSLTGLSADKITVIKMTGQQEEIT